MGRLNFNWDDVPELYLEKKLSLKQIAKIKGSCTASVCYVLEKAGIPRRQAVNTGCVHAPEKWLDLEELYIHQKLPVYKIAKMKHSISRTVRKYLTIAGIPIRNYEQAQENRAELAGHQRGKYTLLGYTVIYKPEYPRADHRGYVREHIMIWEQAHGKPLPKGWVVHHLNGVPSDNRLENLIALPNAKHVHILRAKGKRIRELETKIQLLERTLETNQMIWWGENIVRSQNEPANCPIRQQVATTGSR